MENKHIWEGWTVQSFIDELEPMFNQIMSGQSWKKPFKDRDELKKWCMENQPYYKKYIKEVVDYFWRKCN
jgi:hypothetical protein